MKDELNATQKKIIALARRERGGRTREQFFGNFHGISFNTYVNFESGSTWPRARTTRQLENLLGWQDGIIDDVMASDLSPAEITLSHMRGHDGPDPATGIAVYSTEELIRELQRRRSGS